MDGKKKRVPTGDAVKIYPAIIDIATFEAANASRQSKRAGRKSVFANLFSGSCRCQECAEMTFRAIGNPVRRYLTWTAERAVAIASQDYIPL